MLFDTVFVKMCEKYNTFFFKDPKSYLISKSDEEILKFIDFKSRRVLPLPFLSVKIKCYLFVSESGISCFAIFLECSTIIFLM